MLRHWPAPLLRRSPCSLLSQYLNRGPLKQRPTAHLSYDEGLHLIRSFLEFASHHTVEELQAFTAQWVPHPQWVKVDDISIPEDHITKAAGLLEEQLGEDGIRRVGGRNWWQWRKPNSPLNAEWIEMKSDAQERKLSGGKSKRVMLYIHGGAYFFGSVDEHRYQMQRHARKLKARVLAPKYRLAPQFPFPCGLLDCVAVYLYLLTVQDPSEIILAGDSAGAGMVVSVLCTIRDSGIPLPAGAVLISPWVDLTHSFPSVGDPAPLDYIPQYGFHHKPSRSWPPPNEDDINMLKREADKKKKGGNGKTGTGELQGKQQDPVAPTSNGDGQQGTSGGILHSDRFLSVNIDGKDVRVKDQIQMYTTNELLDHPLVSPIMQPTLGGLPPLLIMAGGGEILRDEQIFLAHKCANPTKYAPPADKLDEKGRTLLAKYKPTDVQLQVWEDLCHVAPTLSFTRPAKYMYRSVAQFGAWCLARAQQTGIEILDDDNISIISSSETGSDADTEVQNHEEKVEDKEKKQKHKRIAKEQEVKSGAVGKAGDPLPPFINHMVRQRVTRHGVTHPLAKPEELPGCCLEPDEIGVIKSGQVQKWLTAKGQWDTRYATTKAKVHKKIISDMATGYREFEGEQPPPSALAGRLRLDEDFKEKKRMKSLGLAMWSLWGSKHDEATVERQRLAGKEEQEPEMAAVTPNEDDGARSFADIESQAPAPTPADEGPRSRSRRRFVYDENQTGSAEADENTPVAELLAQRQSQETSSQLLGVPGTGATGKRPFVDGIAMPFTIKKEADTASMVTLNSNMSPPPSVRPSGPRQDSRSEVLSLNDVEGMRREAGTPKHERPGLESFVTADEINPKAQTPMEANGTAKEAIA